MHNLAMHCRIFAARDLRSRGRPSSQYGSDNNPPASHCLVFAPKVTRLTASLRRNLGSRTSLSPEPIGDYPRMIDPLYSLSGFGVGLLVGMTGVGGGSLMTPLLILLFGIHPATAVGTDLLYAAATKTGGSLVHGIEHNIEWPAVRRLAAGSVPATMVTLAGLSFMNLESQAASSLITLALCGAMLATAGALIFRGTIVQFYRNRFRVLDSRNTAIVTVIVGAILAPGGCFLSWRRSHRSCRPSYIISTAADGQSHRVGHCPCSTANTHRGNRALDDRDHRLAYLRFAAGRFVARHYCWQLYRHARSRTGYATIVGCDPYCCCRHAPP